jgi:hypothetical protein
MVYSLSEKIWIGIQLLVLVLISSLLYYDINKRIQVEGEKIIGSITFKQRTVQRKYASHVVWEDLEQNFPLHNKDSIRTATEADAEITLNDGTKINLSENSMILLNLDEEKTSIDFAYGSVSAKNEGGTGATALSIKSGDSSVSIGNGDVKLSKSENKDLNVTVEKGIAEIFSFGKEGQKVGADEKALVGANSEKVEIKKVDLKLVSPSDNARFFSPVQNFAVAFEFTKDSSIKNLNFEISTSSDFKKVVLSKKTPDKQLSVSMKEGVYYWRVTSGKDVSPTRRFSILQNRAVRQIAPINGFRTSSATNTAYVNFSWTKSDLASNYKLDISPNPDYSANVQSSVSSSNYISLPMAKGKYYWRVGANLPTGDGSSGYVFSSNQSFEITYPEKGKPPTLFNPASKSVTYSIISEKKGVVFNWSKDPNIESYEFQLASNSKFDPVSIKKNLNANFLELKEKLTAGTYYWRVNGKSKDGVTTEFSNASSFEEKDINSLRTFSPDAGSTMSAPDVSTKGLTFTWEKLPIVGKYSLQISEDQNFQKLTKNIAVAGNRFTLKDLAAGNYYWKVSLTSETGEPYLASSVSSFSVRYLPEIPKALFPKPNASLAFNVQSLKFQWTKGNTPNYEFKIFQKEDNKLKELFTRSLSTNEVVIDKSELPLAGNYEWSISGVGESGVKSTETFSKFQILPEVIEKTTETESVEVPVPKSLTLLYPLDGQAINISPLNDIGFKWTPMPGIKKYKFALYDGKKEIYTTTTTKSELRFNKLELLDRKQFRWSVTPVDDKNPSGETSGIFKVDLDAIKEEIEIISPDIQYDE